MRALLGRIDQEQAVLGPRDLRRWDGALAALALALLLLGPWVASGDEPDLAGLALAAVMTGAVAVRRLWPAVTLVVITAGSFVWVVSDHGEGAAVAVLMGALMTAGNRCPPSVSVPLTLAVISVVVLTPAVSDAVPPFGSGTLAIVGWLVVAAGAGFVLRSRRAELAAVLQREAERRDEDAARRVDEERLRIARELHDTVGHSIAALGMQAGVAAHVLDDHPDQAREALDNIADLSRSTLQEIRGTLGLLRSTNEGDQPTGASRQPDYTVDGLFDVLRARGIAVTSERWGEASDIPASLQPVVYRIVQESVTNILRHARGVTTVEATTEVAPGLLVVAIVNDGDPVAGPVVEPNGHHGLSGMRERAASVGGTVTAEPRPGGGFDVRAVFPLGDGEASRR